MIQHDVPKSAIFLRESAHSELPYIFSETGFKNLTSNCCGKIDSAESLKCAKMKDTFQGAKSQIERKRFEERNGKSERGLIFRLFFLIPLIVLMFTLSLPFSGWSSTPKELYFLADNCYIELKKDPNLKKYRHHWLNCIDRFEKVYANEPHNPWAAAGMYRAAQIQLELHKYSNLRVDYSEAVDRLNRIVSRYPESLYTVRAKKLLASIESGSNGSGTDENVEVAKSSSSSAVEDSTSRATSKENGASEIEEESTSSAASPDSKTVKSKRSLKYLTKKAAGDSRSQKETESKDSDIDPVMVSETKKNDDSSIPVKFSPFYRNKTARKEANMFGDTVSNPSDVTPSQKGAALKEKSGQDDFNSAQSAQNDAPLQNGKKTGEEEAGEKEAVVKDERGMDEVVDPYPPHPDKNGPATNMDGDAFITGLRYWSTPNYTRVVIDSAAERKFTSHLLDKNPELNKPQRLYVDIEQSVMGESVPAHTIINDDLLTRARAGQHTPHSVRVVVDIKSFDNYKIFSLNDPYRIVMDVWGQNSAVGAGGTIQSTPEKTIPPEELSKIGSNTDQINASAIAKQLALGVKTIVIDPGHGGKDPGALGYFKGVYEKDVVLSISKKLAQQIQKRLQCNVILTRSKDRYLTLEERTAIANTKNADLFISLHCNAARNKKLTGIETFYLNLATDESAINVAARENATSRKNISDLQSILNDLMKNAKINESSRLANMVQDHLFQGMSKKYTDIRNLGVKQAPFYVLLGATMPSILIETSFISNKIECRRLTSAAYQHALCDAIVDGIEQYIKETDPRAI